MSAPTIGDVLDMVADLHWHEAIDAEEAVSILRGITGTSPYVAALMIREWEREEYGEPADQWTPEVDDWRKPTRGDDGMWR